MKEFSFDIVSDTATVNVSVDSSKRIAFMHDNMTIIEPQVRRLFMNSNVRLVNFSDITIVYEGTIKQMSQHTDMCSIGERISFESNELLHEKNDVKLTRRFDQPGKLFTLDLTVNDLRMIMTSNIEQLSFVYHLLNRLNAKQNEN